MVSMWLVYGQYVTGIWLVCGQYMVSMWWVYGQYVVGIWSVLSFLYGKLHFTSVDVTGCQEIVQ